MRSARIALLAALVTFVLDLAALTVLTHPATGELTIWPMAGVGPVALMLCPRWRWPPLLAGFTVATVAVVPLFGITVEGAGSALAGICEIVLTALLLTRFMAEQKIRRTFRDLGRVLLCALAAGLTGSALFVLFTVPAARPPAELLIDHTASHLLGLFVFAPGLLARPDRDGPLRRRVNLEWAGQLALTLGIAALLFLTPQRLQSSSILVLPLFWGAIRLGPFRAMITQAATVAIAVVGTNHGLGRLAAFNGTPHEVVFAMQLALLNLALATLVVTMVAQVRDRVAALMHDRTRDLAMAEQLARIGSTRWEPGGGDVVWSEGMHTLLGTPARDGPSLAAMLAALHPDDRERVHRDLATIGRDGGSRTSEYRIVRDGEVLDVISYATAETGPGGRVRRVFATVQDITEAKAAAEEIRRSHDQVSAVLDAVTGAAIIGVDPRANLIQFFNRGAENLFGYTAGEAVGVFGVDALHDPDELARLAEQGVTVKDEVLRSVASHGMVGRQWVFRRKNGTTFPGQLTVSAQPGPDGRPAALIGVVTDLSTVLRAQADLAESQDRFRLAFDGAPVGMAMVSLAPGAVGRISQVNAAFCLITGHAEADLLDRPIQDLLNDTEDVESSQRNVADLLAGRIEVIVTERRIRRPDDQLRWGRVSTSAVRPPNRDPYLICLVEDITARIELTDRLHHDATHDSLTGLPNRLLLHRQLEQALADPRTGRIAALYLDLDGFKAVNDTQGHGAGDELLIQVADRIAASVRATDVVARLGGDEFAILCPGVPDVETAMRIGHSILAVLSQEFDLSQARARVGASIGVAMAVDGDTGANLLHAADQAMYSAKRAGKGAVSLSPRNLPAGGARARR
ncbi:diguanylate cyclase [Kineosporia sp. J2-2]|uniref:Diguanylate cyclase n=1 Tax=Kineosporia corallincola TaxID=2835133 RepID=A0ABS5TCD9_9ACTN|nr:sensor domain-containing diguanylate cyclase [Kineosporia corallincola]MBT0768750.1 diguanylate cyclase [Kineosporia corallincola]